MTDTPPPTGTPPSLKNERGLPGGQKIPEKGDQFPAAAALSAVFPPGNALLALKLDDHLVMLSRNRLQLNLGAYGRVAKAMRLDGVITRGNPEKFKHALAIGLGCTACGRGCLVPANEIDSDTLNRLAP